MYQKFVMGLPFNRQEKNWFRIGLVLTRALMPSGRGLKKQLQCTQQMNCLQKP
ncbi:hypothetical protein [Anaerosacchariphilus polymeriproducens]|uniref:Uncharacterized protein n=1 Tax=Anaerosacchariphilus polymeriproducens TaxID=1812858 RepID=A0A371AVD0_9FIRM|nr:hypothetical protein [Anaerosacchariphilus polymeriproducens]RDU23523.1 hypothetical protein DWV06_09210 [Anaerosacchariphilus polymeriproducens]